MGARALLLAAGYRPASGWLRMARTLAVGIQVPPPPAGVRLRAVDPRADARAIYALNEAAFAANPEYEGESFADFCAEHLRHLDPAISRLAERDGALVGLALAHRDEHGGFVDVLGVDPLERGHGVGRALLLAVLAACADAELREARLGVSADNAAAQRLYERAGMATRFRVDGYERVASGATGAGPAATRRPRSRRDRGTSPPTGPPPDTGP